MILLKKISQITVVVFAFQLFSVNAQTTIKVLDQYGQSLPNAVIELPLSKAELPQHASKIAVMDQVDKQFSPKVLVIQQGQSVSFPNSDNIRHHVYSFSSVKPFEIKLYSGKSEAPVKFDNSGVSVLGCNIHDSMVGYIYISQSPNAYLTNERGKVTLKETLAVEQVINVWHSLNTLGAENRIQVALSSLNINGGAYEVVMQTRKPEPRDTFGEVFSQ